MSNVHGYIGQLYVLLLVLYWFLSLLMLSYFLKFYFLFSKYPNGDVSYLEPPDVQNCKIMDQKWNNCYPEHTFVKLFMGGMR
jgi:hypothetical protein